jgi:hypothetical protein
MEPTLVMSSMCYPSSLIPLLNRVPPRLLSNIFFPLFSPELSQEEAGKQYWGDNYLRLTKIKAKYDPNDVFRNPQSVIVPGKLEEELISATHGKSCGGCVIM